MKIHGIILCIYAEFVVLQVLYEVFTFSDFSALWPPTFFLSVFSAAVAEMSNCHVNLTGACFVLCFDRAKNVSDGNYDRYQIYCSILLKNKWKLQYIYRSLHKVYIMSLHMESQCF